MSLFGNGRPGAGSEVSVSDRAITRIWSRRPPPVSGEIPLGPGGAKEQRSSTLHIRAIYVATAEDRLTEYLDKYPELVTAAVTAALERDLALATEYGDLDAAQLAAEAAASIHALLGDASASLARYLDLIRLQASRAETMDDLRDLRVSALVIGAMALAAARPASMAECWMAAAEADLRLADLTTAAGRPIEDTAAHLLDALRAVADVGDLLADIPMQRRSPAQLRRFVNLLGNASEHAVWADWPTHEVMAVRALARRYRRICSRMVADGTGPRSHPDAAMVAWVEAALRRLSLQQGG